MKHLLTLICIIILLFVSQVMLYIFPLYGLIVTAFILALFMFFAVYDIYDLAAEEVFAYASILPFLSLLSFSLPWFSGMTREITFYFFLLILSELFYSFLPVKQKLYHTRSLVWLPLTILIGGALGWAVGIYSPHGTTPMLWGLFLILLISISEAVYFQGLMQNAVSYLTDSVLGVLFTVFIYGFFHASSHINSLGLILLYILCGSIIYMKWKNIYLVMSFYFSFQLVYFILVHSVFLT